MIPSILFTILGFSSLVAGHASPFHPSMWGFNATGTTYPYDNRPVAPLLDMVYDQWWMHGHLDMPPNDGDFFELPAGQPATMEIACDKGATSYYTSNPGGDIRQGNNPCPNSPIAAFHTNGLDDLKGCALAITHNSDINSVQPEDFAIFTVNHTCVWNRFTDFAIPAKMPACPPGGCICAFFWIHSADSGSEQNYMNGFRCQVTGATSTVPISQSKVPRRCGADPENGKPLPVPSNCTYGAKTPFYWFQKERNNMFEGAHAPPYYNELYNFMDGAQDDIFVDSVLPTFAADGSLIPPTPSVIPSLPIPTPSAGPVLPSPPTFGQPYTTATFSTIATVPTALPGSGGAANQSTPASGKMCRRRAGATVRRALSAHRKRNTLWL